MDQRRVALVTGSATGIGRAVAWRFAEARLRGDDQLLTIEGRREETAEGVGKRGGKAVICAANIADDAAVRAMVERTIDEFGALDVLVNNAGTTQFIAHDDLEGMTEPIWDEIWP